jgi:outer membrane protein TolC
VGVRRWRNGIALAALLGFGARTGAAQPVQGGPAEALTFERFRAIVESNHPVAQQARLVAAQARSASREAWGAFDPKVSLSSSQKAFKGQPYYNYLDASLKVPTPLGSDLKLGFERAVGPKVSADRSTPPNGLLSLGLSIPLGQRLITDERRTALTSARAMRDAGDAEQRSMLNKLLLDAAKSYGNWYASSRRFQIADDGVRLAAFRFEAVAARVRNGDSAPIDTLEAALEVQRRTVLRAEADVELRAAAMIASTYLWDAEGRPIELDSASRPVLDGLETTPVDTTRLVRWLALVAERHPELRKAEAKLRVANAERLLAWQGMLPLAEASMASLAGREDARQLTSSGRWGDNYKAGLEVQSSLLLLKERGKAARSAQKAEFARWDRDELRRELAIGVRIALNDVMLLERVLSTQRSNVRAATLLRDAEQQRFENGESTLLLVNLRERVVLDEATKLAALEGKLGAARAALVVAIGDPEVL